MPKSRGFYTHFLLNGLERKTEEEKLDNKIWFGIISEIHNLLISKK